MFFINSYFVHVTAALLAKLNAAVRKCLVEGPQTPAWGPGEIVVIDRAPRGDCSDLMAVTAGRVIHPYSEQNLVGAAESA